MRSYLVGVLVLFVCLGCSSSGHKLLDTNFSDLSTEPAPVIASNFPSEIADSLGWGNLTEDSFKKKHEEFRFVLSSQREPYHLFRISKQKKLKGESVLFWDKVLDDGMSGTHQNMKQYLNGRCIEFKETERYEYCTPLYSSEPDWEKIYAVIENENIWTLSGGQANNQGSADWEIGVQARHGKYFRSYSYSNPDQVVRTPDITNILSISTQLNRAADSFLQADNFNTFTGITKGKMGSSFTLCDKSEVWRFQGDVEELVNAGGFPFSIEQGADQLFYISVQGVIKDEWYSYRESSGMLKVLIAEELSKITVISKEECPAN